MHTHARHSSCEWHHSARGKSVDRCDRLRHMLAPCDATVSIWSARASTAPQGPSNALLVAVCPHGGPTGRAGPNDGSTTYLWVGRGCPRCHTSCAAVFVAWHTPAKSGRSRCTTNILSLPFLTELLTVAPQTQGLRGPSRSCTGLSPLAWDCLCVAAPASSAATSKYVWVAQFNVGLFRHRRHHQARLAAAKAARAGRGRERG